MELPFPCRLASILVLAGSMGLSGELHGATLVGHWAFDESAGGIALDSSPQRNDGTIHNALTVEQGLRGRALSLDGSSAYVHIPNLAAYNDTNGLSVGAWIRMNPEQGWTYPCVVDKSHRGPDEPPYYTGYALQDPGDRSLAFVVCGEAPCAQATSAAAINDGAWHFVVGTISTPDAVMRFYLDGVMTGEVPFDGPIGLNSGDLFIGRHYLLGRYFGGLVDEVKVFSGALTPAEVADQYMDVVGAELVGWWSFDEPGGLVVQDGSSFANAGVVYGAAREDGIVGGALSFDGQSSYVQIPHAAQYDPADAVSVEAWIRMNPEQGWTNPCVVDKSHRGPDEPPYYSGYALQDPGDRSMAFAVCGEAPCAEAMSAAAVNDGAWHFVAGTISTQDSSLRFYLDGALTQETSFDAPIGINGGDLFIGRHYLLGRYFAGVIDEVRIYHGALSPEQVLAHYRQIQPSAVDGDNLNGAASSLGQNVPNPFNPHTTIHFDLPDAGPVLLSVFDLAGRLIRTLVEQSMPPGRHEAVWDGRDASGRAVGSGTYLVRLESGGQVATARIGLVR